MKKLFFLAALVCGLLVVQTTNAQNPITTLQHAGTTTVFYGQGSLVDAYNTSVNGDTLCLSTGYFTAPTAIAKGIKIIGAGHFPDSTSVSKRTTILTGLTINAGADSLRLEGIYINGDINYAAASSINYVKIIRCRLGNTYFNSSSALASKSYCSFEECFIEGGINFSNYGSNFLVKQCIISGIVGVSYYNSASIGNIGGGALIDKNIFLTNSTSYSSGALYNILASQITNNIIVYYSNNGVSGNYLSNNIFIDQQTNLTNNSVGSNYIGIPLANIFVSQTGNSINYTHDYHLKSPTTYLGTDGTQVGIYGGTTPFKDKGLPSNPQVIKKSIAAQTDANGNLQINFSAKAQDR